MRQKFISVLIALLLTAAGVFAQKNADADSLIVQGIRLHDEGQYEQALKKFDQALNLEKYNGYALFEKANTYFAMNEPKKALKYLDIIIDRKIPESYSDACYLKGNILDNEGKADEAIAVYRMGIKNGKPNSMLHFNLAITLMGQKKYDEAESELIATLQLRPQHPSSHFYLGIIEADKGLKVKALLSLYYFLTIETQGKRTDQAWGVVQDILSDDDNNSKTMSLTTEALKDEFKAGEMILTLSPAMDEALRQAVRDSLHTELPEPTKAEHLAQLNARLFQALADEKGRPNKDNFWWDFYGEYFVTLHNAGHTDAASYYIALSGKQKDADKWLSGHEKELNAFAEWYDQYWKE